MAVYYVWSGATGSGNGSSWANAFTTLVTAFTTEAAGDTLYIAHDHAESTAGAVNLIPSGLITNPTKVVCVNRAGSVPPVSADRRTTAQVTTTGAFAIAIQGVAHFDGIIFNCGTGATAASLSVTPNSGHWVRLDNCSLRLNTTAALSQIVFGSTAAIMSIELNNTTMSFGHASQTISPNGIIKWRNTASALLGTIPTALFSPANNRGCLLECFGVDFSALGSGKTLLNNTAVSMAHAYKFVDCKLNAAVTKFALSLPYIGACEIDFVRSSATGNYSVNRPRVPGTLQEETTIVRTGGATDGTTPIAWAITTTANCTYSMPFECPVIAIWNDTTGSARTATVEGVWGSGSLPLDSECFLECEYLGDAASPQGSFIHDGTPDLITTPASQTTSSATWGGSTTKFKLNVTLTAQQKGWIFARVKCAKASTTFYIDPLVTLT